MSQAASFDGSDYRARHVHDQALSGMSIAAYCRRHKLCQATFYNWRRLHGAGAPRRLGNRSVTFTEIGRVGAVQAQWAAEIVLASGTVVRVSADADAALLRRLLEVVS